MARSFHSSITGITGKQSTTSEITRRKSSTKKLKKSSIVFSANDGFKEAFYHTCAEMEMTNVPTVKTLTAEPESWVTASENFSSQEIRALTARSTATPGRRPSKEAGETVDAAGSRQESEILTVYGSSTRPGISAIICRYTRMNDHIMGAFQRTLNRFQTLRSLRLEFCQLSTEQIKALKYLLIQNPNIIDLCLNGNAVQRQPFHILLKNTQLLHLSLKFCNITDRGIAKLAQPLATTSPQTLLSLNLSSNTITDDGANYIADALRTNRTLTHLSLADNYLTDKGCSNLMYVFRKFVLKHEEVVLRRHRNLHYLLLKDEIMKDFTKIKKSEMGVNAIKSDHLRRSTSSARMKNGKDKSSTSSSTRRRSSADSKSLASLIESKLPRDMHPFMHECTEENLQVFCRGNYNLTFLNLSHNKITDAGLAIITETLKEQQYVRVMDDTANGLSKIILEGNNIKYSEMPISVINLSSSDVRTSRFSVKERKSFANRIVL